MAAKLSLTEVAAPCGTICMTGAHCWTDTNRKRYAPAWEQSLIPRPNRIKGGSYEGDAAALQPDPSEPDKGNAIHGLTRWRNWEVGNHTENSFSFTYAPLACQGWSWVLDCQLDYRLDEDGLDVRTTVTNRSPQGTPTGQGRTRI